MNEHPQQGGSYVRQPDGTLKRADDTPATAVPAAESPPASTPRPRSKGEK